MKKYGYEGSMRSSFLSIEGETASHQLSSKPLQQAMPNKLWTMPQERRSKKNQMARNSIIGNQKQLRCCFPSLW
jgi:hypothetical protein